ncbi:MAG: hypothetical protein ACLP0J_08190 [Solirubrobacteraceae bacterium]
MEELTNGGKLHTTDVAPGSANVASRSRRELDFASAELSAEAAGRFNLRSYGWSTRFVFAEELATLDDLCSRAQADPGGVPRASYQYQVITADARAFRWNEPNEHPDGWPTHVERLGSHGEIEICRYR